MPYGQRALSAKDIVRSDEEHGRKEKNSHICRFKGAGR